MKTPTGGNSWKYFVSVIKMNLVLLNVISNSNQDAGYLLVSDDLDWAASWIKLFLFIFNYTSLKPGRNFRAMVFDFMKHGQYIAFKCLLWVFYLADDNDHNIKFQVVILQWVAGQRSESLQCEWIPDKFGWITFLKAVRGIISNHAKMLPDNSFPPFLWKSMCRDFKPAVNSGKITTNFLVHVWLCVIGFISSGVWHRIGN